MLNRLLFRFTANRPCRLIKLNSGPYLERYFLFQFLGVTFYLHRFVSSDSERHTHNHPWKYGGALVLCGGYLEERVVDLCPHVASGYTSRMIRRRRLLINIVNGNTFHRIATAKPGTWTLFFHGARERVPVPLGENDPQPSKPLLVTKGWGILRADQVMGCPVTVFIQHTPRTDPEWWLKAPLGREVDRVAL